MQLQGCNNAALMKGCAHTHTKTHKHWEITEPSFSACRDRTEVERERSHWNGRTNYKRGVSTCDGKINLLKRHTTAPTEEWHAKQTNKQTCACSGQPRYQTDHSTGTLTWRRKHFTVQLNTDLHWSTLSISFSFILCNYITQKKHTIIKHSRSNSLFFPHY